MTPLVAILTSRDIEKLDRCIKSVLVQAAASNIVVIINSLDERYQTLASDLSTKYSLKSIITESNGKPGKGKNSVLSYFLSTEYEYLIPVEGDDYLLPNAIETLVSVHTNHNMDLLSIIDSITIVDGRETTIDEYVATNEYTELVQSLVEPNKFKAFALHIAKIRKVCVEHDNFLCRFILMNRKVAKLFNFNENLLGAEDTKEHVKMKLLDAANEISYKLLSTKSVYVYDFAIDGTYFSKLFTSDPRFEMKEFWDGIDKEQIAILNSHTLEKIVA